MCQAHREVSFGFTSQTFPAGTHICYLYNDDEERQHIMGRFVESGLRADEQVGYLADAAPERLDGCLAALGVGSGAVARPGQLLLSEAERVYCPDGAFNPERMLDYWRTLYRQALENDFSGIRATGETSWIRGGMPGMDRWMEYEAMINLLVEDYPISGIICQYDVRCMDGAMLFDVLSVHPLMIVAGQIVHNPYFQPPQEFLSQRQALGRRTV